MSSAARCSVAPSHRQQLFAAQRPRPRRAGLAARAQGGDDQQAEQQQQAPPSSAAPPSPPPAGPPLGDPAAMVVYGGRLPAPRRLIVSGLSATAIVLGGNLAGVTSWLLGRDGGRFAAATRLDMLVPVAGFKRCLDAQNGFSFRYPARWLADQTLYRRYAERVERQAALDPPSLARERARLRAGPPEPAAAFGPPGSTGEENISVIVAPIREGFTLQRMGTPEEAATRFLSTTVAPEGSGKTAVLLGAGSRVGADGQLYYWQEFTVESAKWRRHNLSTYSARNGLLYTINCQCPAARWAQDEAAFRTAAASFEILDLGAGAQGFPDRI